MKDRYDIIVAGGGFAGVCAAISASRMGKDVCLVEKHNCLGGAAASSLVMPFMYYWTQDPVTKERINLSCGLFGEIVDELVKIGGTHPSWQECFNEEALKLVLNRMAIKSGVKLIFQAGITDAYYENNRLESIKISHVGGQNILSARYFIDATGDGNLCQMSGVDFMLGRDGDGFCQPMTLNFRLADVDIPLFEKTQSQINELFSQYKKDGKISIPRQSLLIFKTIHQNVLHFNSTRIIKLNPTDVEDITRAEILGREQVFEIYSFLKESFEAFKNATLLSTGMQIGVRESRRIIGEHILTRDELIACTKFEDSIACCNYDIDIHNPMGEGTSHHYFKSGEYYTIPYGCLIPKGSKNLLVAGRCISATHEAQASIRIMPTCATTGQAAGIAAALAHTAEIGVKELDIGLLQNTLIKNGAKIY